MTLNKLFQTLETTLFPALVLGVALWVLVASVRHDDAQPLAPAALRVWVQPAEGEGPTLAQVQARLQDAAPVMAFETRLSTQSVWFSLPALAADVLELPSRHASAMACYDGVSQQLLGRADRSAAQGQMQISRGGFALQNLGLPAGSPIICQASFRGPAKLSAAFWTSENLQQAQLAHRDSGIMIEAGLGVLALFMLLTAWVNRSALYLTFVGWLLLNMRMASLSAGTDWALWGVPIPPDFMIAVRQWTVCLYGVATVVLFCRLFQQELQELKARRGLLALHWAAVVWLFAPLLLTFEQTLLLVWPTAALGTAIMAVYLVQILRRQHSRVALWYAASIAIALLSSLNEVLAAATGQRFLLWGLNSVTAAITSALLVSFAVAEHMRSDRLEKIKAQKTLQAAYQGSPVGLFTVGAGGKVLKSNQAFDSMTQAAGAASSLGVSQLFEASVAQALLRLLQEPGAAAIELQTQVGTVASEVAGEALGLSVPGPRLWFLIKASVGDAGVVEGTLQDITERVLATQRLEFMVNHDPLTDCLNLRGITRLYERSESRPDALAYFDLDRFKLINDLYGHSAGDQVLRQVSQRIQRHLQTSDLLARLGGDEFLVAFSSASLEQAHQTCKAIVGDIASGGYQIGKHSFSLSVSGGLVRTHRFRTPELKEVISAADTLCRMAKKSQDERLVVMESGDEFFKYHKDELELIAALQRNETPGGLFLVMQPEISLTAPFDSLNFEVLLRLRKSDGQILPAGLIIEAAEAYGKSAIIDRWVISTTIAWLEQHQSSLKTTRFVGVNLSGGSLNDEAFTEELFTLFERHPVAMGMICLEITETVALKDMQRMQRFIERVRALGIKVALDDFGAGYSSFGYLKGLTVDALKLDGSLVRDAAHSPSGMAIIEAIATLVSNLGMKSIGEFAEDLKTLRALSEAKVDYAQGYAISKPVLPERILQARSGADLIEDPQILAFVRELQAYQAPTLPLFEPDTEALSA